MTRDRLLAALTARLVRIQAAQDPALALEPGALEDAQRLAGILHDDDGDVEARFALGWFYWYRHLRYRHWALEGQARDALREASQALTPCFFAGVEGLPEPLLPLLAQNTVGAAAALLEQAESSSDLNLITTTVLVWQRVLDAIPAEHPGRAGMQANLGNALLLRFWRSREPADVDEAITLSRTATQSTPAGHPERAGYLNNLGNALQARFERLGAPADLDEAITSKREAVQAIPAGHPDRSAVLVNLCSALRVRFDRRGMPADLDEAITLSRTAVQATPDDHPRRPGMLAHLGGSLRTRFGLVGNLADLDEAITMNRAAVQATPLDHYDRSAILANLGLALVTRFGQTGALADLDEAITLDRAAVQATPDDHPDQARRLVNLGYALQARFERLGALADLDEAITVGRKTVQATPGDHPDRTGYLVVLGIALQARFERVAAVADLDEAITVARQAAQATPDEHPDQAGYLSSLGVALLTRFERVGVLADLDEAITVGWRAVQAARVDHPSRARYLSNVGLALRARFERTGVVADLDEAVGVGRAASQATPDDHPDHVGQLMNLCAALQTRFQRTGALADLDEAIRIGRKVVPTIPIDHTARTDMLSNLGLALQARFERVGALADVDEAITVGRAVVQATPVDHSDHAGRLSNLGIALRARFERVGALTDLNEAVTAIRAAVQATPADHPNRVIYLHNLSGALLVRFRRVGALTDLDEAIAATRSAAQATPDDHSYQTRYLANLGVALWTRFERTGVSGDLDEAITIMRAGVQATSVDHPERAIHLSNLGAALRARFERAGMPADLDEAIAVGRAGVQATPVDHPRRAMHLANLGLALRTRFERTEVSADLDEAITIARAVLQAIPTDHPDRAKYLSNLAATLQTRFDRRGESADLDEAITTLVLAAEGETGAASVRIGAARVAATLSAQTDPRGAAELLAGAVRLLPKTTPRQFQHGDQQYALRQFAGLAGDAAALALLAGVPGPSGENPPMRALRLLELGRGVLLSQALDTRSDLTDLQAGHPELAARFIELRDQLDQPGDTSALADDSGMATGWGERRIEDRHQLAAAFEATVAGIRGQDGFETFLLPPEPDQLIRHTQHGPVVVVNVSRYGSDAILLTPAGTTAVPLPGLARSTLSDQIISFHQALRTAIDPEVSSADRIDAQHMLSAILEWLWDVAAQPILDELGYRQTPAAATAWPRLWWVPGGLLGFLPLHAAGYHREPPGPDGGRRTVMDRVISSYTPIVRALGYARERTDESAVAKHALIVAMPTTPGDDPLRHVVKETDLVRARLPEATVLIESPATTDAELPTKATVLALLAECSIAHFACHGHSHPSDPSQSLLLLHDHDTDPLTVASLAPIRLDHARLAYLSACRTAFNHSTDLIDEAINLTTAFQLAGYPHVVGTLWDIDDARAVDVVDAFYTALAADHETIDTGSAAQALHHAVRVIRDGWPKTPSLWAAYLHAGA